MYALPPTAFIEWDSTFLHIHRKTAFLLSDFSHSDTDFTTDFKLLVFFFPSPPIFMIKYVGISCHLVCHNFFMHFGFTIICSISKNCVAGTIFQNPSPQSFKVNLELFCLISYCIQCCQLVPYPWISLYMSLFCSQILELDTDIWFLSL